jgi:hypothetical protein
MGLCRDLSKVGVYGRSGIQIQIQNHGMGVMRTVWENRPGKQGAWLAPR